MIEYLKKFDTHAGYTAYTASTEFITPNVSVCEDVLEVHYNPCSHDYSKDYLTTVALESGTINFSGSATVSGENKVSYSINGGGWSAASQTPSVNVNAGDKVLWKGNCTPSSMNGVGKFTNGTATFDVEGNAMSLLFDDEFNGQTSLEGKDNAFRRLFTGNTKVISAENLSLPATTLAENCYAFMFKECTNLTTAPSILPATTLAEYCYDSMFASCTGLTSAPELPATTLATSCYYQMFYNCTSLATAPKLPATTLATGCYNSMFTSCSGLTTAPELPAMTLVNSCYYYMFYFCSSLNSITCLATDISASQCTSLWVDSVASSGTFTKAAGMTNWTTGDSGIPNGWAVVDK